MSNVAPIVPNLGPATTGFTNKYGPQGSYTGSAGAQVIAALNALPAPTGLRPATSANTILPMARFDLTRANRGMPSLTAKQSALALRALATGQPATAPRRQGFFKSVLSDARALVGGIPKLPFSLIHEAQQITKLPQMLPEVMAESSNPLELIGNAAALPGLRMVPGAFVANQLAGDEGQGLEGLRAHPLFTALDILPAASGAAKTTAVAKAARVEHLATSEALARQAAELTGAAGNARLPSAPRPLQTVLTRRLDDAGNVVPNRLGNVMASGADALFSTPAGRGIQGTFLEKVIPRTESRYTSVLRRMADESIPRDQLPTSFRGPNGKVVDLTRELDLRDRVIAANTAMRDAGIDAARSAELYDLATNPRLPDGTPTTPERIPGLSDAEQAVLVEIREIQAERARLTEGDLTRTLTVDGVAEVYDITTARKISRAQTIASQAKELASARAMVLDPTDVTPEKISSLIDEVQTRRAAGDLTRKVADDLERTYAAALDEAGYRLSDDGTTMQQVARPSMDDVVAALRPYARTQPVITRLIDHIQQGRWSAARKDLDSIDRRTTHTLPIDLAGFKDEMSRLITRDRTLARTSAYTDKRVARLERLQQKVETNAVPARFTDMVQKAADDAIANRVKETYASSPDLDQMIELAHARIYDPISQLTEREVRTLQKEARASWKAMRDQGLDPIFFSRVNAAQRKRLPYVRVSDTPVTPAAAKARMWDAAPYQKDMGVALTSDALQLLQRRATEAFLDEIPAAYGKTRADLATELLPRAKARHDANPNLSLQHHLDNLINDRWAPWDRSKFSGRKSTAAFAIEGREQTFVPRVMSENLERLYSPPPPKLTAAFDPIMRVFRTSVLPLAPRWHLYNAIGGAVMTAIEDPRAFRYLPETMRDMWGQYKEAGTIDKVHARSIDGAPPAGFGTLPAEVRAWDAEVKSTSPYRDRLAAAHNYAAGRTLSKWFNEARDSRLGGITDTAKRGLEKSYTANQLVDDMYRSIIGTSARNRALAKGASAELADAAAVSSIRRVFQSWDEMTPMERSIMRSVVPFYGWSAHILKYAFKYPMDHPLRVSILGSFARAELTDSLTGLPDYIRDMVLIGDKRANGVVKAINVGPFNPFRDLPSYFTVAGFLGNLNPVLTGVLETVGVNVQQGGPSLYPETRYDPETGHIVADPGGNLLSNIIGNISPQTNLLTALIGQNEAFNETLARDPSAAGRQLMSNLGIPVFFRDIDVGEQLIRSELARYEDQEDVRKEALSTGNLSMLSDFPGLKAYGEQIRALEAAGELDQYRVEDGEPGAASGQGKMYALQVAALGG